MVDVNELGEVWIKGLILFCGYLNQFEVIVDVLIEDGWFCIGDIGVIDEEGFLFIVDCIKDMILCGGENVSCFEVEGVLVSYLDIIEVGVIGIFDECLGEIVGVVILLCEGVELLDVEIIVFIKLYLVVFKWLEKYWCFDVFLLCGGIGKVDKLILCKMLFLDGVFV